MKSKTLFLLGLLALSAGTCIREIDLRNKDATTETLVIEGDFTNSGGPHRVLLTLSNRFNLSRFEQVMDADVRIFDNIGSSAQYRAAFEPGLSFYELPPGAMPVFPGRLYHLEVILPNGRKYESEPQPLPGLVEVDSLTVFGRVVPRVSSADVVVQDKRAVVNVSAKIPGDGEDYFLRWEVHSVYYFPDLPLPGPLPPPTKKCYVYDWFNAQNIVVQDATGLNGRTVGKELGSKLLDFSFDNVQYFTVVQRSLSRRAFSYWEKIGKLSNPQGTVFDPPPAAARGNLFNPDNAQDVPLGFFEVSAVDTLRKKVYNGDLGPDFFPVRHCEGFDFYFGRNPECFDCLRLKNSTLVPPHYW